MDDQGYPPPPYWPENLSFADTATFPFWENFLIESDAVHHAYLVDAPAGLTVLHFRNGQYADYDVGLWPERAIKHMQRSFGASSDG